jgi:hypothetical protein
MGNGLDFPADKFYDLSGRARDEGAVHAYSFQIRVYIFAVHGTTATVIDPNALGGCHSRKAGVAELVDAPDLGSGGENRGGSSPSARTIP